MADCQRPDISQAATSKLARRRRLRRTLTGGALVVGAVAVTLSVGPAHDRAVAQSVGDPVIFAAGDIACGDDSGGASCRQLETSNLLFTASPSAVLPLGDVQYEDGAYGDFQGHYHPSWGRRKSLTRPAIGNHELNDPAGKGTGYWDYFNGVGVQNGPAGERGKGYYSYNLGNWHLIALNSNCSQAGCSSTSAQVQWLRADLTAHPNRCTLAYMHHPRWTSDTRDFDKPELGPIIQSLYDHQVDVLLVGHSHFYERFAPQDPSQRLDTDRGTRHFIVGTGGRNVYGFGTVEPNSQVRNGNTFGVLRLDLHPTGYDWRFLPISGQTFTDSGSTACHRTVPDTTPPTTPTNLEATPAGSGEVRLTWSASSDQDSGVARYRVYRDGTQIATASGTEHADTAVQANTTYRYHVVAEDGAGNLSGASTSATVTTPPPNEVLTVVATDDAHVASGQPTSNFGSASLLEIDNSPVQNGLLKFDLAAIANRLVVDARLRLYALDASGSGGRFFRTSGSGWSESTVTWNSAPATEGAEVAALGSVSAGRWYEADVTDALTGGSVLSLRITSPSSDGVDYSSAEGAAGFAPELRLTVGAETAPNTTITSTPPEWTNATSASFSFTGSTGTARFECRRDGGAWASCTSPASVTSLANGPHSFDVRAVNAAGDADPTPATHTWNVDTVAPSVPSEVTATAASTTRVDVAWTASSDTGGVARYRVLRDGVEVGASTTTTFADTTVQPGTSYAYRVMAVDRAGNASAASTPASVTTPSAPSVLSFAPAEDTYVRSTASSSNFGSDPDLEVDNSPIMHTLLKFNVSGIGTRSVASAKLRLYCLDSASFGGEFRRVASSTWSENTVTWNTAPSHDSTVTATLGSVQPSQWYEVDVTPLVARDGTVSMKILSTSSNGAIYSSTDGPAGFAPELRVTLR